MFPKLTIHPKGDFNFDGLLTESLIFYQQTNLILSPKSLPVVLASVGYRNLIELIEAGDLVININSQALGVTNHHGNEFIISAWSSEKHSKGRIIADSAERIWGRNIQSNNQKKHLLKLLGEHKYGNEYLDLLLQEVCDRENFLDAIVIVSQGEISRHDIEIELSPKGRGLFHIESNLDNSVVRDAAFLICTGSGLLHDSKMYNSELVGNSSISTYPIARVKRLIDRRKKTEGQIKSFHEFVFPEFYDLKSTVDSGAKTFNEIIELWREAKKFKHWLKDEEPTAELLTAYLREVASKTWLAQLPVKTLRWFIFTAVGVAVGDVTGGAAGTAADVTLGFLDDMLLDGILRKGYKPNQFVDTEYRDFLNLGI